MSPLSVIGGNDPRDERKYSVCHSFITISAGVETVDANHVLIDIHIGQNRGEENPLALRIDLLN